jgi:hypothetical protein
VGQYFVELLEQNRACHVVRVEEHFYFIVEPLYDAMTRHVITFPREIEGFYARSQLVILRLVTLYRALRWPFVQARPEAMVSVTTDSAPSHRVPFLESYIQEIRCNNRASETICTASLQRNMFVTITYPKRSCSRAGDSMSVAWQIAEPIQSYFDLRRLVIIQC